MFCEFFFTVCFRVISFGGVFRQNVFGNARPFPAVPTIVKLEISLKQVEIYKLYGLCLILVNRKFIGFLIC